MDEESIRSVREMVMENSILQQREMQAEILYQKEMEAVTKDPEYSTAVDYDGEPIDAGPPGDEVIGDDAYEQESLASMREVIDDSQFDERGFNSGVDDAVDGVDLDSAAVVVVVVVVVVAAVAAVAVVAGPSAVAGHLRPS